MRIFPGLLLGIVTALLICLPPDVFASQKLRFFILKPPSNFLIDVQTIVIFNFSQTGDMNYSLNSGFSLGDILSDLLIESLLELNDLEENLGEAFALMLSTRLTQPDRGIGRVKYGLFKLRQKEGMTFAQGGHTDLYRIISKSEVGRTMKTDDVLSVGTISEAQAVKVGEEMGAQVIILGSVQYDGETSEYTSRKMVDDEEKELDCLRVEAATRIEFRVVRVPDGYSLVTRTVHEKEFEFACEDEGNFNNLPDVEKLIAQNLRKCADKVANYIAPHYVEVVLKFENIKARPYRKKANRAIKMATVHRVNEAYAMLRSLVDEYPSDEKLLYNLGVLHEVVGNIDEAEDFYRKARDIKHKDNYEDALLRVAVRQKEVEEMAGMGIVFAKYAFE